MNGLCAVEDVPSSFNALQYWIVSAPFKNRLPFRPSQWLTMARCNSCPGFPRLTGTLTLQCATVRCRGAAHVPPHACSYTYSDAVRSRFSECAAVIAALNQRPPLNWTIKLNEPFEVREHRRLTKGGEEVRPISAVSAAWHLQRGILSATGPASEPESGHER